MKARLHTTALFLLLALGASAGAAAQSRSDSAWLPVWNKASGKLEAYLVLEPAKDAQVPGRWRFGNNTLDATYGLEGSDSLAVLCNGKGNFSNGLGQLPNNCLLATLGERLSQPDRRVSAGAAFSASVVGHVLDTPGQPAWSGLGVGLTWRTPWSGELTVGADNVVTRGKNPFSVGSDDNEGTVPYVRYEQDL